MAQQWPCRIARLRTATLSNRWLAPRFVAMAQPDELSSPVCDYRSFGKLHNPLRISLETHAELEETCTSGTLPGQTDKDLIVDKLRARLPRLVFAGLDGFPLAGGDKAVVARSPGLPAALHVLAVCAVPCEERLLAETREALQNVVSGAMVQLKARLLHLQLGAQTVVVCWHDVVDFAHQLFKGSPSCVNVLNLPAQEVLYAGEEWRKLRGLFDSAACRAMLHGKSYRSACAGPALSLLGGKGAGSKAKAAREASELDKNPIFLEHKNLALALCRLACPKDVEESLRAKIDELAARDGAKRSELFELASNVMKAALKAPNAIQQLPVQAVDSWVDAILLADFEVFAKDCARRETTPIAAADLPLEWGRRLRSKWPQGADLIFMAQTGSFLYDLHIASSDSDFSLIYLSPVRDLASRSPPSSGFQFHVNVGFGLDKAGEVEYSGKELGDFVVELAKGNPRNIELLFTEKPHETSSVWQELRARRRSFLTCRCVSQYMGFISDRLHKAAPELDLIQVGEEAAGKRFSKFLYGAWHKIFDLQRVLEGKEPLVALKGDEHSFVMGLRLRPPASREEAQSALDSCTARLKELGEKAKAVCAAGSLPVEVDAAALSEWLQGVRASQAASTWASTRKVASLTRSASTRSSGHDEFDAIVGILEEVERTEGIRIAHAAYAPSSRTLGTCHEKSDHDVHVLFVLQRSAYFGLEEPLQKFRRSFPATEDMCQVDVSGWEVRHASRLLMQSNPSALHMLFSPVQFKTTRWTRELQDMAIESLNYSALALAWWKHGRQNYQDFISRREAPVRKKYVHVLRPLLCIQWLLLTEPDGKLPPAVLLDLAHEVAATGALDAADLSCVEALVGQRDLLPRMLPKDKALDQLVQKLLQGGQALLQARGVSTSGRSPLQEDAAASSKWNSLCVQLIEDLSSFTLEV